MKREELENLAKQSRIKLTDAELDKYAPEMGAILDSVNVLNEVDTEGKAVYSPHTTKLSQVREDVVKPGLSRDEVLKNAPFSKDGLVIVYGSLTEGVDA